MSKVFSFPVHSARKIPCPYEQESGENPQETWFVTVNVKDIPSGIPMRTNPREQKLTTQVAKDIKESLLHPEKQIFYLLNRGLVISADSVEYNNKEKTLMVTFTDEEVHGDIDGGHTYAIITKYKNALSKDQYVRMEIMTGVEGIIDELAAARNTSVQVDDESIAELEGKFEIIKEGIAHLPFSKGIYFKQNDNKDKKIPVREIVAILTMFNIQTYNSTNQPIIAYSSKGRCIDFYLDEYKTHGPSLTNPYYKMRPIIPDIFKLYNIIEKGLPEAYNKSGGNYARFKFALYNQDKIVQKLKFSGTDEGIHYRVPEGFIYPILSAFRALVELDPKTDMYKWKADPFKYLQCLLPQIASTTINRARTLGYNPNAIGKDTVHWETLHMMVENKWLREGSK